MKNKDYVIRLEEESDYKINVYLEPHNVKIESKSLFSIKLGYIVLNSEPNYFHCIDSGRMSIDVMESILSSWKQLEINRKKSPI